MHTSESAIPTREDILSGTLLTGLFGTGTVTVKALTARTGPEGSSD